MNTRNEFNLRYFRFHGIRNTGARGCKLVVAVFTPDKCLVDPVDTLSMIVKPVVAEFMTHVKVDQQCTSDTDGQAHQVDE